MAEHSLLVQMNLARHALQGISLALFVSILAGCVKEIKRPDETNLREVVFHAGWDAETKTVLQEDGQVFWEPGDEISLFIKSTSTYGGGYKLTSTNTEPAPKTDFEGLVGQNVKGAKYVAVYPYNFDNSYDGDNVITFNFPYSQTAKEGSFGENVFVSIAVSDTENLFFRNVCGGIKFSVADSGVNRIELHTINKYGKLAFLSGDVKYDIINNTSEVVSSQSTSLIINAPDKNGFEVGKYYYAVVPAITAEYGLEIYYYKGDKVATYTCEKSIEFKRGVFKRLYDADSELSFIKQYNSRARFLTSFIPDIDRTRIKHLEFHSNSTITSQTLLENSIEYGTPIYYEMVEDTMKLYTSAEVFQLEDTFHDWSSLETIDLSNVIIDPYCGGGLFSDCHALKSVVFNSDLQRITNISLMFGNCYSLEEIDLTSFDTRGVTDFGAMFRGCTSLKKISIAGLDMTNAVSLHQMFYGCTSLEEVIIDNDTNQVIDMSEMFALCGKLKAIYINKFSTKSCQNMEQMFFGCKSLKQIDLSHFNTENVTSMSCMFYNCESCESLNLSGFNTSNVIDMYGMFYNCGVTELDLHTFDTSKVLNMGSMFYTCVNLKEINISSFNTCEVESFEYMFSGCHSLENIDVSSFNTEKCKNYAGMFDYCQKLKTIDISGFKIQPTADVHSMLSCCYYLQKVNLGTNNLGSAYMLLYKSAKLSDLLYIICSKEMKASLVNNPNYYQFNSSVMKCYTYDQEIPEYIPPTNNLYWSIDFSMDGKVEVLQSATEGEGIDIVILGDGYSDRLIKTGEYLTNAKQTAECIFTEEPFKSHRNLFNVFVVYSVSNNEVIGRDTAFDSELESDNTGITGDLGTAYRYAKKATGRAENMITILEFLNDDSHHGSCEWAIWGDSDGYGNGRAVARISKCSDDDLYKQVVLHEFGHGFGKLGDEYNNGDNTFYDINMIELHHDNGIWMNLDINNNSSNVLWADFLNDSRYANADLGIYQGGAAYYRYGIWRPSQNSIMNHNTGGYNAPSRKAIYNRIHKLAYGKDWQYDYETFVQQDLKNIQPAAGTASVKSVPYPVRVNRKPLFKMEESTTPDGKKMVTVIMD